MKGRLLFWPSVVCALGLAVLNLLNLLGWAYAHLAERAIDQPAAAHVLPASQHAARITPWSVKRVALQAWIESERGHAAASDAHYQKALRWGPGDALLWGEYAQVLARLRQFERVELLMRRATELAPASPVIRASAASMGVNSWEHGSTDLRNIWLLGMRHELDRNRKAFLQSVIARGRMGPFCTGPARELGLLSWCTSMRAWLNECRAATGSENEFVLCMARR